MNNRERIKVIDLTVIIVLTVEVCTAALLREFGLVEASFGRGLTNSHQNGQSDEIVSDHSDPDAADGLSGDEKVNLSPEDDDENGTTATTAQTTGTDHSSSTKKVTGTTKKAGSTTQKATTGTQKTTTTKKTTTTTKNNGGDNDGDWLDDWF